MRDDESPLLGVGVLVTRPAHQAAALTDLIKEAGGDPIAFPTIEIVPPVDPGPLLSTLDRLEKFHLAVFISVNAVEQTFGWLLTRRRPWPPELPVACVGPASKRMLEHFGVQDILVPVDRHDSEGLLTLPPLLDAAGKRVVIFRGEGGRELLGQELSKRGATVMYAETYRRARPRIDPTELIERWRRGEVHVVTVTSTEGLHNLHDMVGDAGRGWLLETPIVVLSEAQVAECRDLGFTNAVLLAPTASDEAILEAIKAWRLQRFSI